MAAYWLYVFLIIQVELMSLSPFPEKLVGGDLLSLITVGMHTNPLVIYREYIQNAVDSIAASGAKENGRVDISINPKEMYVIIQDNGPGLSYEQSLEQLVSIANSHKRRGTDRGFRGIGRLSGLAFADSVTFLTRHHSEEPVTSIDWDGISLRKKVADGLRIENAISECVRVETILGEKFPERFFRVEIKGIARFAAGSILNSEAVRDHIGEVCPVPFASDFQYAKNISNLFEKSGDLFTVDIFLNGDELPITRRHSNGIILSEERQDSFTEFDVVTVPTMEGGRNAAVGWITHSSYLGALPKRLGIRGIRARDGNIQVGNESLFDHLFSENRFNRWCVAEIHILDSRIVPNGRRDYFEPSPHTRNLENHLGAVLRKIERRCRAASAKRNKIRRFQSFLDDAEATCELACSGYLTVDAARKLVDRKLKDISKLRGSIETAEYEIDDIVALDVAERKLVSFRVKTECALFSCVKPSDVSVCQEIFYTLAEISASHSMAMNTIKAILSRLKDEEIH